MCHVCRLMLNGPQQFLDHLQGKVHRTNLKKAHRRQMEHKLDIEPDDKADIEPDDKAPPTAVSDNGPAYMDRDVSHEGI